MNMKEKLENEGVIGGVKDSLEEGAGSEDDDGVSTPGFTVSFLLVGILISLIAVYRRK